MRLRHPAEVPGYFVIQFDADPVMAGLVGRVGPVADDEQRAAVAIEYADRLREELQPLVRSGQVETYERQPGLAGGPGEEFDIVTLLYGAVGGATTLAGVYAAWRTVGADVLAVVRRLRELSGRVRIDSWTAAWCAIDHVAPPGTVVEIDVLLMADQRGLTGEQHHPPRGHLIGLGIDGSGYLATVANDGAILSVLTGLDPPALARLQVADEEGEEEE